MSMALLNTMQDRATARGCGNIRSACAAFLMFSVCCPCALVAIAAPYWSGTSELNGITVTSSASLWGLTSSTESKGHSFETEKSIDEWCDEIQEGTESGADTCDKIRATRFFTITSLFLALGSAIILSVAFSPVRTRKDGLAANLCAIAMSVASTSFAFNFLGVCVIASARMPNELELNGAAFVFLIFELPLTILAVALAEMAREAASSSSTPIEEIGTVDTKQTQAKGVKQWLAHLQNRAHAWGCGHISLLFAGVLMCLVTCPMAIVSVAAPYWTASQEMNGASITGSATLWAISTVVSNGVSASTEMDMCGDEMNSDDTSCDAIGAVRFFTVTSLLLALASATLLLVAFSPASKGKPIISHRLVISSEVLASAVLFFNFLGMCLAGSVKMPAGYILNGAGYTFLILSQPINMAAIVLVAFVLRMPMSAVLNAEVNHVQVVAKKASSRELSIVPAPAVQPQRTNSGPTLLATQWTASEAIIKEESAGSVHTTMEDVNNDV